MQLPSKPFFACCIQLKPDDFSICRKKVKVLEEGLKFMQNTTAVLAATTLGVE